MNILKDIFTYSFRGGGKYVLIIGAILSIIMDLVSFAPLFGLIAFVLITGYFCALYYIMIQSSASGADEAPEFPSISNVIEDIFLPMAQILIVAIVAFGPYLVYVIWLTNFSNALISFVLILFGIVYFPMALLAVIILGYIGAASPHIVLPSIYRAGWVYWVGFALLCILYIIEAILFEYLSGIFIFSTLVMSLLGIFTFMTNARILGLVYRERQEELGWL